MHNTTHCAVPLKFLLLDSQSTVDLIANMKIYVNIRKVRGEDSIRVHCISSVKIVDRFSYLPGYRTVWYETTGTSNILLVLRETKKFRGFSTVRERLF